MTSAWRLLAGTVATLALLSASPGAAGTKTVTFDDVPAGTRVSNEYQTSAGVSFVAGNGALQPFVKAAPTTAHSPVSEAVYDCTGLPGCGEGFDIPRFRGVLTSSASSVSAYVGYYVNFNEMDTVKIRIRAYNADDVLQAESGFVTVTENTPLTQQVTATAPAATIDYFEIVADALGDNSLGKSIAFDDLTIVTPEAPRDPNFTLNQGEAVANVLAGTSVDLPVEMKRINGSNGNVSFAVSGLPPGMTATFNPNPVTGTGTTTTMTLTAAADAPPSDDYTEITVTATPSPGAGQTPRTITKLVRVRTAHQPPECPTHTPPISPTEQIVSSPAELNKVLRSDFTGRVIVPKDVEWEMKDCDGTLLRDMPLDSGVSLIGQRGELGSRPLLYTKDKPQVNNESIFVITGNDVRVDGLLLRGHKPAGQHTVRDDPFYLHAITVVEDADQKLGRRIVITDNEFDEWSGGGVNVIGSRNATTPNDWQSGWARFDRSEAYLVRVVGNYMHHNVQDGGGYGVVVGCCAYVYVAGNVFDTNRHAVAASGNAYSGYIARFNYVLQGGVKQKNYYNQHFDVHGTANDGYGGYAGEYFLIADNTVRGEQKYGVITTRPVLMLRGRPGNPRDHRAGVVNGLYFNDNFVVHNNLDAAVALKWTSSWKENFGEDQTKFNFHAKGNHYNVDYTTEIASGDFDGDGRTDVFLANGTGWFFSRGGVRPWEFLTASSRRIRDLTFADVDNDGITDVVYQRPNGKLIYLKRGTSPSVSLPSPPVPVKDLRFGDFDGDRLTDIFYTRNREWHVWYGKSHGWIQVGGSVTPISEMLFGEFDRVLGSDIAAVRNKQWSYSSGATQPWARLNSKRTDSFKKAVAADFDGNGTSDIAFSNGQKWRYSRDGRGPLTSLRDGSLLPLYPPLKQLLIGHFDAGPRATVVSWNIVPPIPASGQVSRPGVQLVIWGGLGTSQAFSDRSRQNMR